MPFVLNPSRKFTAKHKDPNTGDEFEADFEFLLTEDCFTDEIRDKIKDLETVLESDSDEEKKRKLYKAQAVVWHKLRRSLKAVRGIVDTEGNNLEVTPETQAAIFEFIAAQGDVGAQVLLAYMGLSSKNLKAGATK